MASGEVLHQIMHVGGAFAQRRHPHRQHVQPVVQVFAKPSGFTFRLEVAVGCCHHTHIDRDLFGRAYRIDHLFLQHP